MRSNDGVPAQWRLENMKGAFYEHTSKLSGRKCGGDRPLDY